MNKAGVKKSKGSVCVRVHVRVCMCKLSYSQAQVHALVYFLFVRFFLLWFNVEV